jgi:hypothetical protein
MWAIKEQKVCFSDEAFTEQSSGFLCTPRMIELVHNIRMKFPLNLCFLLIFITFNI